MRRSFSSSARNFFYNRYSLKKYPSITRNFDVVSCFNSAFFILVDRKPNSCDIESISSIVAPIFSTDNESCSDVPEVCYTTEFTEKFSLITSSTKSFCWIESNNPPLACSSFCRLFKNISKKLKI
ncbi:MAG: hypothetical protein ACTSVL_05115 [Promethearchaeota archaeon]